MYAVSELSFPRDARTGPAAQYSQFPGNCLIPIRLGTVTAPPPAGSRAATSRRVKLPRLHPPAPFPQGLDGLWRGME